MRAERVGDDIHDGKNCHHDKHPYNPPQHMLLASRTLRIALGIGQELEHSPEEYNQRNCKDEDNARVDNIFIYLPDQ